jgi:hypothetical protein
MKTLDPGVPDVTIRNSGEMVALLVLTINAVRKGTIDPRIANCVGYLAAIAMRAVEQNELEARIRKLESVYENRMTLASGG